MQELHCTPKLFDLEHTLQLAAHALTAPWRQSPTVAPLHVLYPRPVYCMYVRVPASSVPYVPEAHRAACPVRGMHYYCMYATSFGRAVRMHTVALQVAFVVLRHPVDLLLSEVRLL